MFAEHRNLRRTLMLLFFGGVLCNMPIVEYHQQEICAVRGSSVVILCSFYHPYIETKHTFSWIHIKPNLTIGRIIFNSSWRKGFRHFQYIGDNHNNCSLKINQVKNTDEGKYRFMCNNSKRVTSVGPTLRVGDLRILVFNPNGDEAVKEGDSVNLTCVNSCGYTSSVFTWFKNGKTINEGQVLHLRSLSSENSGNYTCSLKTHKATSGVTRINVEYGPKNTSVSVKVSGSNLTLVCSSDANPAVENYGWYRTADDRNMKVGHQPVLLPGGSGQYFCSVANKHGSQNSSVVTLKMKDTTTFTGHMIIIAVVAGLLIVSSVIAVKRLRKKQIQGPNTQWEAAEQNTHTVSGQRWDCHRSPEDRLCEDVTTEVTYATISVSKNSKSKGEQQNCKNEDVIYSTVGRVQQMDSNDDVAVIYSTVCRSQN
ncbi:opioid-binding protein/cell adhesion molecule homolog isoform 2-T2 [Menidia menidia]